MLICDFFLDMIEFMKDSEKKGIVSGFLVLVVVGFLFVIFVVVLFGICLVKKIRCNFEVCKLGSLNYVKKLNILCNGKVVIIGYSNNGFEEGNVEKMDLVFYY